MKKTRKISLVLSCLMMILTVSMLVSTTFAWFTDSASTGVNKIQAGNLDLKVSYADEFSGTYAELDPMVSIFDENALWEPGYTVVKYLKVENVGTLAFKYRIVLDIVEEIKGLNAQGEEIALSQYLKYAVVETNAELSTRADAQTAIEAVATPFENQLFFENEVLEKGNSIVYALVVYMPEVVGNEANYRGSTVPTVKFGVSVEAKQHNMEEDSYGSDYDENVEYPTLINATSKADGSLSATKNGVTVSAPAGTIPANTPTQFSVLEIDVPSTVTVDTSKNAKSFDISFKNAKTGADLTTTGSDFFVFTIQIDKDVTVFNFKHYDEAFTQVANVTDVQAKTFHHDSQTGIITFGTTSCSPFTVEFHKFAGGKGTEEAPYLISEPVHLQRMATENGYFELTQDIVAPAAVNYTDPWGRSKYSIITKMRDSSFDGKGFKIVVDENEHLFGDIRRTTLKNLEVELNGKPMCYFAMDSIFDTVTTSGNATLGNNSGAFLVYPYNDFTMRNCVNEADLRAGGAWNNYNAVLVGYGALSNGHTLTFENCVNKGSLIGGTSSMFIGNVSYGSPNIVINNCKNEGLIQATFSDEPGASTYKFNMFVSVTNDGIYTLAKYTFNGVEKTPKEMVEMSFDVLGGTWIQAPHDANLALSVDENDNLVITPSQNAEVETYVVTVGVYGRIIKGGSKIFLVEIEVNKDELATFDAKKLAFVDDEWVRAHSEAVKTEHPATGSHGKAYVTYELDGTTYYYYEVEADDATLDGNPKMATEFAVSVYDANGKLLASTGLTE